MSFGKTALVKRGQEALSYILIFSGRTKKKQWGQHRGSYSAETFDAMYYMGSTTAVGEPPSPGNSSTAYFRLR